MENKDTHPFIAVKGGSEVISNMFEGGIPDNEQGEVKLSYVIKKSGDQFTVKLLLKV